MRKDVLTNQNQTQSSTEQDKLVEARKAALQAEKSNRQPEIKWLTENSRKFLESGYLTDGATPEGRIREIAENAEKILKISEVY